MKNWSLTGVHHGFRATHFTVSEASRVTRKKSEMPFREFIGKVADIAVTIVLIAVLISAFLEPLYRDLLLNWLKDILETN